MTSYTILHNVQDDLCMDGMHDCCVLIVSSEPPLASCDDCAGLLVPDIPLEQTDDIRAMCEKHGLELVLLTTPTTPKVSRH